MKHCDCCAIVLILLLLYQLHVSTANEVYVTAYPNGTQCPSNAVICHNISYYFEEVNPYIKDNVVINFLPGIHTIPINGIFVHGLNNITLQGITTNNETIPTLQYCGPNDGIQFYNCENIIVKRFVIDNCRNNVAAYSEVSVIKIEQSNKVDISELSITASNFLYGIHLDNTQAIKVSNVTLVGIFLQSAINSKYNDSLYKKITNETYLNITNTIVNSTDSSNANGVVKCDLSQKMYTVNIVLENVMILGSIRSFNFYLLSLESCRYTLTIDNLINSKAILGVLLHHQTSCVPSAHTIITVVNSVFSEHTLASFSIVWESNISPSGILSIASSEFKYNTAAIVIRHSGVIQESVTNFQIYLTKLTVHNNYDSGNIVFGQVLFFYFAPAITIENSTFSDNDWSAINAQSSNIIFKGVNYFINNQYSNGAALYLVNSYIFVSNDTQIYFTDNHATDSGGAIYIQNARLLFEYCFFQLNEVFDKKGRTFIFTNNTADVAGSAVYGSNTESCTILTPPSSEIPIPNLFLYLSSFNQTGESIVSSDPTGVCLCSNNTKLCNTNSLDFTAYPGQVIEFSVVLIGDTDGSTTGVVQITDELQSGTVRLNRAMCSKINYTVQIDDSAVERKYIDISIEGTNSLIADSKYVEINFNILQCKRGFYLSRKEKACVCIDDVNDVATCYPSEQIIQRSSGQWIGYNDIMNCTIVNTNCPNDYCITGTINITNIDDPNEQCTNNRDGQICGKCIDGYSIVLGSNACKDCRGIKNAFISLIIPFAIAGIVLVIFLLFFNMTVSIGTINGLVFFANNLKTLEPYFDHQHIPLLSQFISWLNLDFGVETCFFNGMTAVQKIGLQFIFPIYLWLIIILIIGISKYSQRLAKLVGNNGIPVLATLILLSYSKIIRTVIVIFSRSFIQCGSNTDLYWHIDPTQKYLNGGHTILFIVGVIVTALFIIPYTAFLLLYPLLELSDGNCRQRLSWFLFKLKPFFDAYRGPHSKLFCIWPGILLVVRIIVALIIAVVEDELISTTVSLTIYVILIAILSNGRVYKETGHHGLDICFIILLSAFTYSVFAGNSREKLQNFNSSFGIGAISFCSLVLFIAILCYHANKYTIIGKYCREKIENIKETNKKQKTVQNTLIDHEDGQPDQYVHKHKMYDGGQLRESLLEEVLNT